MSNRSGNRGKRRAGGNWTNRFTDPTPEEIAAWKAALPSRTHKGRGVVPDAERTNAAYYAWLADPEDIRPLAAVDRSETC
jgi:hypothetical protein